MPCGSRGEYRPRSPSQRIPGRGRFAASCCEALPGGGIASRFRDAPPFGRVRPPGLRGMDCLSGCSFRVGRRGLRAVRVLSGRVAGTAWHGLSAPGPLSWVVAGAACRAMGLSVGAAGRAVPEEGCVRSPVRPAIPPKRTLCANRAFSRSPARGGRDSCVRPVPMPRSRGCRALRRVRRCGAVRRVRPFRAWGRGCRGRASRP